MQISFDRLFAKKIAIFFAKLVLFNSLCQSLSKKLNFIKIWQLEVGQNKDLVCYRKKQSFRRVVLVSIKGLWVWRKSQKISTASDQYFLSYVKKLQGGGQLDPPPAGIGLKVNFFYFDSKYQHMTHGITSIFPGLFKV